MATDTITMSQSPALTILHALPDREHGDTTVRTKSENTCQAAQCHIPGVKKSYFFSIFTNSNQIQELVTLLIPVKTYGYLKSTFSKVWLHHINQRLKTVQAAISTNDLPLCPERSL
jgi:hypothetical protein